MASINSGHDTLTVTGDVREGTYGDAVVAIEPGGAEFIPLAERHGHPSKLFFTWVSPNMEFATVYVGVIAVAFFGQTLPMAILAIVVGTGLGSVSHGILSARGPGAGVPQMILSRISFGFYGNILPAGLNAVIAGIGWFAVNSVSGTFALNTLTHIPKLPSLLIVVVAQIGIAFLGHNFLHAFERYAFPFLVIAFVLAALWIIPKTHPSAATGGGGLGGWLIAMGAAFGYAAGWNPYASDYTRYLSPTVSKRAVALWAGLGVFVSCVALEVVGALSVTIASKDTNPTTAFTGHMPTAVADIVLLAIVVGAISANAINVYSGTMSFLALGIELPLQLRRAIVAAVAGVLGFLVAWNGLSDVSRYENFLLVIAYWIGPWLGVFLVDQWLRRGHRVDGFMFDRKHNPWGGFVAMAAAMAISIWLFSNQQKYVGVVPKHWSSAGDLTFEVGFVLAAVIYYLTFALQPGPKDEVLVIPDTPAVTGQSSGQTG
ncbi:MAG: purine-cytosine permease family protein [Actinomycetales bacterium]